MIFKTWGRGLWPHDPSGSATGTVNQKFWRRYYQLTNRNFEWHSRQWRFEKNKYSVHRSSEQTIGIYNDSRRIYGKFPVWLLYLLVITQVFGSRYIKLFYTFRGSYKFNLDRERLYIYIICNNDYINCWRQIVLNTKTIFSNTFIKVLKISLGWKVLNIWFCEMRQKK